MESSDKSVTVVFLMWLPEGMEKFQAFIDSYINYPAGMEHRFIVIFKDAADREAARPYQERLQSLDIAYQAVFFEGGFDIGAYYHAASVADTRYVVFFNTNSAILADHWLEKMYAGFVTSPRTGVVGCTGSFESLYSTLYSDNNWKWDTQKTVMINYRKYKLLIKGFFYWRFFVYKPFPNPHFRSNAFMITRDLFLNLKKVEITSKFSATRFESGRNSASNQIWKLGYEILVVDRYGNLFKPADWVKSGTYRSGGQMNLLVSDNQTRNFDRAPDNEKKRLAKLTWGI
jgi:hypothetical protein